MVYDDRASAGQATVARERRDSRVLAGLCVLTLALRLPQLSASFYGDETFSLLRDSEQLWTVSEDRFRPLFFSLLYLWKQLGFHTEAGLRALPLTFGVLQVPVGFLLARELAGFRAALLLGVLLCASPLLIEFSQELRMYSLVPLVGLLQALGLARLGRRASSRERLPYWALFAAAGAVGVYTHFHYWFLNGGFAVALLRRRAELPLREGLLALAAIGALYAPNVPNLLRFESEGANQPHLTTTDLAGALPKLMAAFTLGFNYFALPNLGIDRAIGASTLRSNAPLAALALVPLALVLLRLVQAHWRRPWGPTLWMAHELFTVPTLASFLAVVVMHRNFIHPKYMVFCAPFWLLFFVVAALEMTRKLERAVAAGGALLVFGVAYLHFNDPRHYGRREDYRAIVALLRQRVSAEAGVLWLGASAGPRPPDGRARNLVEYYAGEQLNAHIQPVPHGRGADQVRAGVDELIAGKREVYFVWLEIARNTADPTDSVLGRLRERLGEPEVIQMNPRALVYHWKVPAAPGG